MARIDALKGFAIICVVTYHATGQYFSLSQVDGVVYATWATYLRAFLFSFMLPLFAFLSGYVLGRADRFEPRDYFRKRTLGLLVPYVVWEIIYGPSKHPEMLSGFQEFLAYGVHIFVDPHFEGRMWYLYVLWLALMALGLFRLKGDHTWAIVASIPAVYLLGSYGHFEWLRWIYIYVAGGVLFRRFEPAILPQIRTYGIAGALGFVALWPLAQPEHIAAARLAAAVSDPNALSIARIVFARLPIVIGACAIIAIYALSFRIPAPLEAWLAYLGALSLGIYVTHFPFVEMWKQMPWWFLPINVVVATVAAVVVTLLLGKFRVTATLLLGEPWVARPRQLGDIQTETL